LNKVAICRFEVGGGRLGSERGARGRNTESDFMNGGCHALPPLVVRRKTWIMRTFPTFLGPLSPGWRLADQVKE
jgi:hypothetical protein